MRLLAKEEITGPIPVIRSRFAGVAQWQSNPFVRGRLRVQVPSPAPVSVVSAASGSRLTPGDTEDDPTWWSARWGREPPVNRAVALQVVPVGAAEERLRPSVQPHRGDATGEGLVACDKAHWSHQVDILKTSGRIAKK